MKKMNDYCSDSHGFEEAGAEEEIQPNLDLKKENRNPLIENESAKRNPFLALIHSERSTNMY